MCGNQRSVRHPALHPRYDQGSSSSQLYMIGIGARSEQRGSSGWKWTRAIKPTTQNRSHTSGPAELSADLRRKEQIIPCASEQCVCGKCVQETTVIGYEQSEQSDRVRGRNHPICLGFGRVEKLVDSTWAQSGRQRFCESANFGPRVAGNGLRWRGTGQSSGRQLKTDALTKPLNRVRFYRTVPSGWIEGVWISESRVQTAQG